MNQATQPKRPRGRPRKHKPIAADPIVVLPAPPSDFGKALAEFEAARARVLAALERMRV